MNFGSIAANLQSKAQDALSIAKDTQRRMTQQALEAAGMAEKSEDESSVPELAQHARMEKFLRQLYEHTDSYMRHVNGMMEASRALAEDFNSDDFSALEEASDALGGATNHEMRKQMEMLGQMVHRKVFKPIRREVEGRKDIEKRLSDRKKVRLDYDAYRRKQSQLMQSDPANAGQYEANLEAARKTFERHSQARARRPRPRARASDARARARPHPRPPTLTPAAAPPAQGVVKEVAAVNREREQVACDAFMALLLSQLEFFSQTAHALGTVSAASAASFDEAGGGLNQQWAGMRAELQQLQAGKSPEKSSPPERSGSYAPPTVQTEPKRAAATPPPQRSPKGQAPHDPFGLGGFGDDAGKASTAPASPLGQRRNYDSNGPSSLGSAASGAGSAPDSLDLLGGFSPGPAQSQPTPASRSASAPMGGSAEPDLFGDFGGSSSAPNSGGGAGGGGGVGDLMGGGAAVSSSDSFMMDMMAAPSLVPQQSAPAPAARSRSQTMPSQPQRTMPARAATTGGGGGGFDPFADFMGTGSGGGGGGARSNSTSVPNGGGGGDLMGGGMGDLMGGGMGSGPAPGGFIDPNEPAERAALRAKREASKQAAIDEKVSKLREEKARQEGNKELERDLEKVVGARVAAWKQEKKNLRALLADLHNIAPPCSWKQRTLGELLDKQKVKKAYQRAILAVHPDKQDSDDVEKKVLAQHIFDALRDAWNIFEQQELRA